jgi:hypothetical protein
MRSHHPRSTSLSARSASLWAPQPSLGILRRGSCKTMHGAAILFITSEDVVQGTAATRSYVSLFRLGGLSAKASLVEGRVEAIWLPLVDASLLRKDVVQGRQSV